MFIFLQLPFPLFLLCPAIVRSGLSGLEGAGEADSWFLHQERGTVCELASCIPPDQGTVGQESLSSLCWVLRGRACLLGWNWAQQPNWSSLCSLGFDSSPSLFLKKKSSGQVAKKSLFRTEAPPKNSLAPGAPGQGKSQSYFSQPWNLTCLSTQSSPNPSNWTSCAHSQLLREGARSNPPPHH